MNRLAKQVLILAVGVVFAIVMVFVIIRLSTNAMTEITENAIRDLKSPKDNESKR